MNYKSLNRAINFYEEDLEADLEGLTDFELLVRYSTKAFELASCRAYRVLGQDEKDYIIKKMKALIKSYRVLGL